jgi:anti-sigma B factor antagonist
MFEFRVDSRDVGSGRIEIRVEGEADLAVADRLEAALDQASSADGPLLIDLSACDFIDSTAIALLLRKQTQLEKEGRRLAAWGASGQVLRILAVAGLTDSGFGFEEPDEALSEDTA